MYSLPGSLQFVSDTLKRCKYTLLGVREMLEHHFIKAGICLFSELMNTSPVTIHLSLGGCILEVIGPDKL